MNGSLFLQWHTFLITCILSGKRVNNNRLYCLLPHYCTVLMLVFNEHSQGCQFETISVYLPYIKRNGPDYKGQYEENKNSKSSSG